MSKRRADFFMTAADELGLNRRIGMGDSLGVSAIQGMYLHGEGSDTFDGVLLRDGWNLDEATTTTSGLLRYAHYQLKDAISNRKRPNFEIPNTAYDSIPKEKSREEPNVVNKLRNVADIMRDDHNRKNALLIAGASGVAMHIVTLTNGLSSGNTMRLREFTQELKAARARGNTLGRVLRLVAKQYPGWHSDLLDPRRGANDLNATIELSKG